MSGPVIPPRGSGFPLTEVYRALGFKDARSVPTLTPGFMQPVIVVGSLTTFAAEVVEARSFSANQLVATIANRYTGMKIQSLAKGGIVIEALRTYQSGAGLASNVTLNRAPVDPWSGGTVDLDVINTGGQPAISVITTIANAGLPVPQGRNLGGTSAVIPPTNLGEMAPMWVPPGFFFWITVDSGTNPPPTGILYEMRWREVPEAQGAA